MWLIVIVPALIAVVFVERRYAMKVAQRTCASWQYFRVLPKSNHQLKVNETVQFLAKLWQFRRPDVVSLRQGQSLFRSIFRKTNQGQIEWYLAVPEDRLQGFAAAFHAAFPTLEAIEVGQESMDFLDRVYSGTVLKLGIGGDAQGLPLTTLKDGDPLPSILYGMGAGQEKADEETVLDIVLSPASDRALSRVVQKAEQSINPHKSKGAQSSAAGFAEAGLRFGEEVFHDLTDGKLRQRHATRSVSGSQSTKWSDLDAPVQNKVQAVRRRYTGTEHAFKTWIRVGVCADPDDQRDKHLQAVSRARIQAILGGFTEWSLHNYVVENWRYRGRRAAASIRLGVPPRGQEMLLTSEELACLWHLPDSKSAVFEHVPAVRHYAKTLQDGEMTEGVHLGVLRHPTQNGRPVALPFEQLTKHFVLSGMTGAGKSSELVEMLDSQIKQWIMTPRFPGFSLIDPAQETIVTLMTRLLNYGLTQEQWSKIHYVSLASSSHPIGLNMLDTRSVDDLDDAADEAMALIKFAYGGATPQVDRLLRNGLRTLLEDPTRSHSIIGLAPLFQDQRFRSSVLRHVKDPVLRTFWESEFADATQSVGPLMNRLNPFISNKTMRRMFGQQSFTPDIRKYMDEGHIFFWDVLGVNPERMKLGAGLIINQYYKAAKSRPFHAMEHLLVVDEAHLVQIPVFAKIQAETRKFGLSLGLSTQFIEQFEDWLRQSIKDIVPNIFSCTLGADAAAIVSNMTNGHFDKSYLQSLPERTVAVYTKVEGKPRSFEVEAAPPVIYLPDWTPVNHRDSNQVIEATSWALEKAQALQHRDAKSAEDVDLELEKYIASRSALANVNGIEDDVFQL